MASRGQTTAMNQIDTIINLWDERLAPAGKTGRLSIDSAAANNDAESISHWGGGGTIVSSTCFSPFITVRMNIHIVAIMFMKKIAEVSDSAGRCGGRQTGRKWCLREITVMSQCEATERYIPPRLTAVSWIRTRRKELRGKTQSATDES